MATSQKVILYVTPEMCSVLPVVSTPDPVYEWNRDEGGFSDIQATIDGVKLWRCEGLMRTGYGGTLGPVEFRLVSNTKPAVAVNSAALLALVGAEQPEKKHGAPSAGPQAGFAGGGAR